VDPTTLQARRERFENYEVYDEDGKPVGCVVLPRQPRFLGARAGTVYLRRQPRPSRQAHPHAA
jgi:hypothetical protein